jgi:hypothetical protein
MFVATHLVTAYVARARRPRRYFLRVLAGPPLSEVGPDLLDGSRGSLAADQIALVCLGLRFGHWLTSHE